MRRKEKGPCLARPHARALYVPANGMPSSLMTRRPPTAAAALKVSGRTDADGPFFFFFSCWPLSVSSFIPPLLPSFRGWPIRRLSGTVLARALVGTRNVGGARGPVRVRVRWREERTPAQAGREHATDFLTPFSSGTPFLPLCIMHYSANENRLALSRM